MIMGGAQRNDSSSRFKDELTGQDVERFMSDREKIETYTDASGIGSLFTSQDYRDELERSIRHRRRIKVLCVLLVILLIVLAAVFIWHIIR